MLVVFLVLGRVGGDGVDVDVDGLGVDKGNRGAFESGFLDQLAEGGLGQGGVGVLNMPSGQQPLPEGVVVEVQDAAVRVEQDRAGW